MSEFVSPGEGSPDFFDRLERELRAAAERRPRRLAGSTSAARAALAGLAVLAALAVALVPAVALLGSGEPDRGTAPALDAANGRRELPPVGTVMEPGSRMVWDADQPRRDFRSTVVATGIARQAGPWQMEVYESRRLTDPQTGELYQPAGLPCLGIALPDPPGRISTGFAGGCGEFPRTPGFSRGQMTVSDVPRNAREILVYGRTPEEAARVVITRPGEPPIEASLQEGPATVRRDFYLAELAPDQLDGEVHWIDERGERGSRGIGLLPP